ncbi:hypothetical protein GWI33_015742 [Rhynchophorus ferrugineus]|uniref:Uncharacterized protein n=1 Tax=Rhynchophorus ferrugineus TaxID=354439 RepID=A0A834I2P8_RHYFE|nr:hypothetical protein GWI33_015742 [Rhynchophorus ferrugineus]
MVLTVQMDTLIGCYQKHLSITAVHFPSPCQFTIFHGPVSGGTTAIPGRLALKTSKSPREEEGKKASNEAALCIFLLSALHKAGAAKTIFN